MTGGVINNSRPSSVDVARPSTTAKPTTTNAVINSPTTSFISNDFSL